MSETCRQLSPTFHYRGNYYLSCDCALMLDSFFQESEHVLNLVSSNNKEKYMFHAQGSVKRWMSWQVNNKVDKHSNVNTNKTPVLHWIRFYIFKPSNIDRCLINAIT